MLIINTTVFFNMPLLFLFYLYFYVSDFNEIILKSTQKSNNGTGFGIWKSENGFGKRKLCLIMRVNSLKVISRVENRGLWDWNKNASTQLIAITEGNCWQFPLRRTNWVYRKKLQNTTSWYPV